MKSVWKLVVKCICVMMPFIVLGCRMGQNPLAFMNGDAPYYIWNQEKTNTAQDKHYRVVILGDSLANTSYIPEILSSDTINLSLAGTTPMTNYYTLQDWLEHNSAPDVCYISFHDMHFQSDDNSFWMRTMYSHRYTIRQNLEMMGAAIANKDDPTFLTEHYWLDFISYQLFLPNKYITSFLNSSFNQRYLDNSNAMKMDELHGGRYARSLGEYSSTETNVHEEFYMNPLFDEYYRKIIELCVENDITPRIVKLPLPKNSIFTDDYKESYHEYYDNLQRDYPSLTVDWFSLYPMKLFSDNAHMNAHGAVRFSTELKQLHPEDFSMTEMDDNQIAAIDDSIRGENKIEWILKWIDGKDYTVLFYDKRGEFKALYEDQLKGDWDTYALRLEKVSIGDPPKNEEEGDDTDVKAELTAKMPEVWAISGIGESASNASSSISVTLAENSLMLQLDDKDPQAWATASDDMLGVAVVDNYTHSVVCMKPFRYVDEAFQLAQ